MKENSWNFECKIIDKLSIVLFVPVVPGLFDAPDVIDAIEVNGVPDVPNVRDILALEVFKVSKSIYKKLE